MTFRLPVPVRLAFTMVVICTACSGYAQSWPERPIKLLAPSAAGGPPDAYARALAEQLAKEFSQPVVVENVPAAGGMIAAQSILRAPADGYTLLVNTAGMMTITPNANPKAQYKAADFVNICQGVEAGLVLATNSSIKAANFAELTRWIHAEKTPSTYSSYSPGSPAHFLGYQLGELLKVEMTHIPYKSSPQQISDMIGGIAPLGFVQIATAAPHIQSGKLRAYATTGSQRSAQLPNVPTVAEVGMQQLETTVWFGLSAPKNVPPGIVRRLTDAHQKVVASAEFAARMATSSLNPTPNVCGNAFTKKMEDEAVRWARIVKATGFVAD
ncbi:MAG: tripartite tricarboxylate transporter substrate binding protein [Burkholderiales bacterium]|nr:tripartite tricarboxylate transporter substrate binding protein [Burkholderiales bacterium]